MKTIQITMDEKLLAELDANPEARRVGRSAILRQAVADYLERQQRKAIRDDYRRAYVKNTGLGGEFQGWEAEGEWPNE